MVLEYGDIDLARLLAKHEQAKRQGNGADEIDENFIRLYWQQMLQVCATWSPPLVACAATSLLALSFMLVTWKTGSSYADGTESECICDFHT